MLRKRIQKYYNTIVVEDLLIVYNYGSIMQLPCLTHATLNTSSKNFLFNKKMVIYAFTACFLLSGQKSILTRAHKSIATFNLREGNLIGCKVSLRRGVMYDLINRLITFILPRVESFSKGQILPANGKKGVVHIGVNNFLFLPEIETFFSIFGLATEFSSAHAIGGFDIICHFSIPKVQVPITVFTHFKKYGCNLMLTERNLKNNDNFRCGAIQPKDLKNLTTSVVGSYSDPQRKLRGRIGHNASCGNPSGDDYRWEIVHPKENKVNELIALFQHTLSPISITNLLVTTFQFPNPKSSVLQTDRV